MWNADLQSFRYEPTCLPSCSLPQSAVQLKIYLVSVGVKHVLWLVCTVVAHGEKTTANGILVGYLETHFRQSKVPHWVPICACILCVSNSAFWNQAFQSMQISLNLSRDIHMPFYDAYKSKSPHTIECGDSNPVREAFNLVKREIMLGWGSPWPPARPWKRLPLTCNSAVTVYLLWPLEADPALRGTHPAVREARERGGVQVCSTGLEPVLIVPKRQAAGPGVCAVVVLLVIPARAAERRPPTVPYGESPHPAVRDRVRVSPAWSRAHQ